MSAKRAGTPPPEPSDSDGRAAGPLEPGVDRAPEESTDERARKPFVLRLPPDLHNELRAWAAADLRSLNGQIEWVLRDAVRKRRNG